jgi:hypothetical protein
MKGREEKMNDGTAKRSNNSEERNLMKYNKWEKKSCRDTGGAGGTINRVGRKGKQ